MSEQETTVEEQAPTGTSATMKRLEEEGEIAADYLEELTRLAVQTRTGERSRLMLDIAGHRQQRKTELTAVAEKAVAEVKRTGESVALDAMNPFERKVVHDVVAAAGLSSDSKGVEPDRHVVILPGDPS